LAQLPRPELLATDAAAEDPLTQWAAHYLATATDRSLQPMLDAAMQRRYSGSPQTFSLVAGRTILPISRNGKTISSSA
jgi:hypothetical protein